MSALDLTPQTFNWPSVTQGDTFPAINFTASGTGTAADLSRVRVKIKDTDGNTELSLDSDASGVTINTATAGAWDYTVGPITDTQTTGMDAGTHLYDLEVTDADGTVRTHFKGTWTILDQTTN